MHGREEHYSGSISMLLNCGDDVLSAKVVLCCPRMEADERRSWVEVV